ncbi:MAG TPA: hypothetical protein VFH40_07050, partial [Gemmatimonadales bacterium]|nr:hypothetical protein [Gemmatimonadales bacterium]
TTSREIAPAFFAVQALAYLMHRSILTTGTPPGCATVLSIINIIARPGMPGRSPANAKEYSHGWAVT